MLKWLQFWKKTTTHNSKLFKGLFNLVTKGKLDSEAVKEIERQLISADVGVSTTAKIIGALKKESAGSDLSVEQLLKKVLCDILSGADCSIDLQHNMPHVIMLVGINGVGKTTTSAKLANFYKRQGKKVMLAAADTFRAAATEQLQAWAKKLKIAIVAQQIGADSSAVLYDALASSQAKTVDVDFDVVAGTGGQVAKLQTNLKSQQFQGQLKTSMNEAFHEKYCLI